MYTGFQNGFNALFRNEIFWNVADGPMGKLVFRFNQLSEALSLCGGCLYNCLKTVLFSPLGDSVYVQEIDARIRS